MDSAHHLPGRQQAATEARLPVVSGYTDGTYHPEHRVTRDQTAVYMPRALDLPIPDSTP
jgi:hypothetical protein